VRLKSGVSVAECWSTVDTCNSTEDKRCTRHTVHVASDMAQKGINILMYFRTASSVISVNERGLK
jgi:hypothetical protein